MDIQDKVIILRIHEDLKNKFKIKCESEHMKVAVRLKYLIGKDIEGKLIIK